MPTSIFSKLQIYFSTKSPSTSIYFHQLCTSFLNLSLKKICFVFETISSLQTPPYPASYCTHINTLIAINGLHSSVNLNCSNFFRS